MISIRFDADPIVHGVAKALLAPEVPLGRLDAHVAEQKLDLLQLATGLMTQARARSPQVVRATPGIPHFEHAPFTTPQITFGLNPFAAIRPALFIARKIVPEPRFAAVIHARNPAATHKHAYETDAAAMSALADYAGERVPVGRTI